MFETITLIPVLTWIGLGVLTVLAPGIGGLALLFGYALADRAFALIFVRIASIPLFISEWIIGLMLIILVIRSRGWTRVKQIPWRSLWTWFAIAGGIGILRGLMLASPILVLRDAAIAYYAVITLLVIYYVRRKEAIYLIFCVLLGGLVLRQLIESKNMLLYGDFVVSTASGMYSSLVILGALCAYSQWEKWRKFLYPAFVLLLMGIFASEIRTIWVAYLIAAVFASWAGWRLKCHKQTVVRIFMLTAGSLILLCGFFAIRAPAHLRGLDNRYLSLFAGRNSPDVITRVAMWEDAIEPVFPPLVPIFRFFDKKVLYPWLGVTEETAHQPRKVNKPYLLPARPSGTSIIASGLKTEKDTGAVTSFQSSQSKSWLNALNSSPILQVLLGVPFGQQFIPGRISFVHNPDRYDPHNSLVALWYRMGLIGLVLLVGIIWQEMKKAYLCAHRTSNLYLKELLLACMTGVIYHLGHSLTDVTLENSFKGGILWLLLGLLIVLRSFDTEGSSI